MQNFNPPIFYGTDQFNAEKSNNLKQAEVLALQEQNRTLQALANSAKISSEKAEKSARSSKICSIISVVIAALMFIVATVSVAFEIYKFNEEQKREQFSQSTLTLLNREEQMSQSNISR